MTPHSARGFIIHRLSFGNTSTILRCLTQEAGRVSLMAKGAQRPKSPFLGSIDLFYFVDILFVRSRSSDLHSLREIKMLKPNIGLRQSYGNLLAAQYFAELIEAVTESDTPLPSEYELFEKAIAYLNEKGCSQKVILRFEARLLNIAGLPASSDDDEHALHHAFHQLQAKIPSLRGELMRNVPRN